MNRNQQEELRALQDTLYFIGGKWRIPIINALCNGKRHFIEIQKSIPGITKRMLSKELKEMELNKLLDKLTDTDGFTNLYIPTEYCRTFGNIIQSMIDWGRSHRRYVMTKE
ncbi:winged helix-turn-helix transcriptional regulator [Rhizosphaericola mali]|uniref:Helix-turn-helix transcriptional regulator n=1 Tax=Rhizosphaericola mali TaxID=2545455 RepID=A0A5P2FYX3_9BACT|nr:helix-turn-helix domain-containing protein [Rhizosphaericola mali]QES88716.1 helix-turn-helix transcriptional regulator [Rhizosphaericola mali]